MRERGVMTLPLGGSTSVTFSEGQRERGVPQSAPVHPMSQMQPRDRSHRPCGTQ